MRRMSPKPWGRRAAWAAWHLFGALALATALAAAAVISAQAQEPLPADLQEWAAEYPFQFGQWQASAHGTAYLEGDENAPGCTDCHEDPETGQVYTPAYRLEIPSACSTCHADPEKMKGSELATDVYETYLADTHGRKIEYYRQTDPQAQRFEAVCSDCHGSHTAYVVPAEELAHKCQSCHGTATERFSTAAMGHFRADRQAPLAMAVRIFYLILVPAVLGVMLGYIGLDLWHRARSRSKGRAA